VSPPRTPAPDFGGGVDVWLRRDLAGLIDSIEQHGGRLRASLWLFDGAGERQTVREARSRLRVRPCWSTVIRDSSGAMLGAITVAARTSRGPNGPEQQLTETLARTIGLMIENDRASEAADEYRELLDEVPAVIYIADPGEHGRWRYVSPQIESLLGFSPSEWQRDPDLWAQQLHPADRDWVVDADVADAEVEVGASHAFEYRMLHRTGTIVWVRDDARLVRDSNGLARWHGVLSDITERKRADAELERRAAQQAAVARLGEHALERVSISDLLDEAVRSAAAVLGVEATTVAEFMPEKNSLDLRAAHGWPKAVIGSTLTQIDRSLQSGYTLISGGPVVVRDWTTETRFARSNLLLDRGAASSVSVIIEGRDHPFGVFEVASERARDYSAGDIDFVQSLANVLADALERQSTEDRIAHHALHDTLTGLPNRALFLDRLERALERIRGVRGAQLAVLFIDLDHFKLVNDSLGHHAGDEVLAEVAARLRQTMGRRCTVARFGGDEFGLLLEDVRSELDAIAAAEKIAAVFARPFVIEAGEYFISTSIGIALASGTELPNELVRDADSAMYRAKERGRARYELFDEMMRARTLARLRVESDLRRAIDRDELWIAYQPVVSLHDGSIAGVEALLRWDHPTRGAVGPEEFIPVAEENGLIERIGSWVLEEACRQAAQWCVIRQDAVPINVSVNLSPQQLTQDDFLDVVRAALAGSGLDPTWLSLEITESNLLEPSHRAMDTLRKLRALGVRIVLDDFGTGYSSLSYLTRLPLNAIKIDRSFIEPLDRAGHDTAIVEAIIAMTHALSLKVLAEGTERSEQVAVLQRLGCEFTQGFLFSPPVSGAEMTGMVRSGAPLRADLVTPVRAPRA
jgi:diguanylate cyclase (GGDEF)-like protein/PAS domain S-box-containing protein